MKNKLLLLICLLLFMIGCTVNDNNDIPDKEDEPYGKYSAHGRIVKMDKEGFHIKNEENVDLFNVDTGKSSNFFIGEYVRLESLDGEMYDVTLDEEYDYSGITENLFDEASKLNIRVAEISRDETGKMRIYGLAADNKEYDIAASSDTVTNFSHSTLKVDDEIFVYPENVSGDIPAVVEAKAILKKNMDWQNKYYWLQYIWNEPKENRY